MRLFDVTKALWIITWINPKPYFSSLSSSFKGKTIDSSWGYQVRYLGKSLPWIFLVWAIPGLFLVFNCFKSFWINDSHHYLTMNSSFPHLDKVGFDSGLISVFGRESWVWVTDVSLLYKTERLPSHDGNVNTMSSRCSMKLIREDLTWNVEG